MRENPLLGQWWDFLATHSHPYRGGRGGGKIPPDPSSFMLEWITEDSPTFVTTMEEGRSFVTHPNVGKVGSLGTPTPTTTSERVWGPLQLTFSRIGVRRSQGIPHPLVGHVIPHSLIRIECNLIIAYVCQGYRLILILSIRDVYDLS